MDPAGTVDPAVQVTVTEAVYCSRIHLSEGLCHLQWTGLPTEGELVIEVSTNLVNWVPVCSNSPPVDPFLFSESTDNNGLGRFYRAFVR